MKLCQKLLRVKFLCAITLYRSTQPSAAGWMTDRHICRRLRWEIAYARRQCIVPSPTYFLSILGAVGLTAYFGLLDAGQPKAGETVLVSGAAGAVGSAVGQIAKIEGCRAVGIAGGPVKCKRLIEEYGYDAAIDYRGKDAAALEAAIVLCYAA